MMKMEKEIEADADDITSVSKCKKFYSTNKYLKFRSNGKKRSHCTRIRWTYT